jgi:hypothetical protein
VVGDFGKFPRYARSHLRGDFSATAALAEFVCLMGVRDNRVRISVARLAVRMGCSESTAKRAVRTLLRRGLVTCASSGYSSNVYTVVMEGEEMEWEWDTLGEDTTEDLPKPKSKGGVGRLVDYFRTTIQINDPMGPPIQSQVNGPALSKHFKELLTEHGLSEGTIKKMITMFATDIQRGVRTLKGVPAWRGFLADRQQLLDRVRSRMEDIAYVDPTVDDMPPLS